MISEVTSNHLNIKKYRNEPEIYKNNVVITKFFLDI